MPGGRGDNLESFNDGRLHCSYVRVHDFLTTKDVFEDCSLLLLERLVHNIKNRRLLSKNESGCLP